MYTLNKQKKSGKPFGFKIIIFNITFQFMKSLRPCGIYTALVSSQ